MKKNCLYLSLKCVVILMMLLTTAVAKSQSNFNYTGKSSFKAYSFEEMAAPLIKATEAFEKAEEDVEEAYVKAMNELEENNYKMALFYFEKCSQINKRFNYQILNQTDLNSNIAYIKRKIKEEAKKPKPITLNNSIAISMKQSADINSTEVTKIPPYATIYIIKKEQNELFMKVRYREYVGYISQGWLNI